MVDGSERAATHHILNMKILLIFLLIILAPPLKAETSTYFLCQEFNGWPICTPVIKVKPGLYKLGDSYLKFKSQQITKNYNLAKFLRELDAQNRRETQ